MKRSTFIKGAVAFAGFLAAGPRARAAAASSFNWTSPYPASDYRSAGGGRRGGTIKVSVATDSGTMDPHAQSSANVQWFGRILFDNLVYQDEHGNATPWLAKSWTISPDGKTYTFFLREDVTFSDGVKFNAEAVLINLEHMRAPATKSLLAGTYIAPYVNGRALDEYTVETTLRTPYSPFLNVLAQSWLAMQSPKAIKERPATLGYHPIGSGPFVLESYTPQQGMIFVRREGYNWSPPLIGHTGPAHLERMEFEFVPDASVRYFSLASGEYDFVIDTPPQAAEAIRNNPALTLTDRIRMGCPNRGVAFNVAKAPFDDARVRRAAARAVDRSGVAAIAGFGVYQPTANFLSVTTPYYDPAFQKMLTYDPDEANRLLDEAGWSGRDAEGFRTKDGTRLAAEIVIAAGISSVPAAVEIQADLKKVGFDLALVAEPTGLLLQQRTHGHYQLLAGGVWHTNTPDALYINYHSSQIPTLKQAGQNVSRLADPELDSLLEQARETTDSATLKSLYSQAQQRLVELVPAVPLYENATVVSFQNRVKGVIYDTSHEVPHFETVWVT